MQQDQNENKLNGLNPEMAIMDEASTYPRSGHIIGEGATTDEGPLEKEVTLTPEQELDNNIKVATMHQVALNQLVQLGIRNYIAQITSPKISGAERRVLALSLERAVLAGLDYGVDVAKISLPQKGNYAKQENSFAAHIARAKENGMVLTAYNYDKIEKEKQNGTYFSPDAPVESNEEKNKYNLTAEQKEHMETLTPKEKKAYLKTQRGTYDEKNNEEINQNQTN